uniref:NADH dehydrogenase [ubiquinone] 1 beta subcomplex subunit 2, mitochondrial n=2 Tax=Rodentia TaxID=9989 RepID=A0A8C9UX29_SPEDA
MSPLSGHRRNGIIFNAVTSTNSSPYFASKASYFSYFAGGGVHIEPRYRQFPQLTRYQVILGEFFSATMWFWILWRFWHDSDAVLGHFTYPDPSQWTDEELGIPPDDED